MTPTKSENDLLYILIERAPHAMPSVRIFRRAIINVEAKQGFRVRNGITGQADSYALVEGGLHVELETKAARGTMRDAQKRWRAWCVRARIPHLVLRAAKGEPHEETIHRWIDELRAVVEGKAA